MAGPTSVPSRTRALRIGGFIALVACRPDAAGRGQSTAQPTTARPQPVVRDGPTDTDPRATPAFTRLPDTSGPLAAGWSHTCAVAASGTVHCWGHNDQGQLGDGSEVPSRAPVQVRGLDHVRAIAAAGDRTCAVRANGSVWCWGGGPPAPLQGLGESTAIALGGGTLGASGGHADGCALVRGEVWCWGVKLASTQSLALTPVAPQRIAGLAAIDEICAAHGFVCGRAGERVLCHDDFAIAEVTRPGERVLPEAAAALTGARRLACMGVRVCALRADGGVGCVYRHNGALGHGPTTWRAVEVPEEVQRGEPACGVDVPPMTCWGVTVDDWRIGLRGAANVQPGGEPPLAIADGLAHTCAIGRDGGVRCIGDNTLGQLGGGEPTITLYPQQIAGADGMHGLVAGDGYTCGLRGGQAHCWGWVGDVLDVGPELATPAEIDGPDGTDELGVVTDRYGETMLCRAAGPHAVCTHRPYNTLRRIEVTGPTKVRQWVWPLGPGCGLTDRGIVACDRPRLDGRSFHDGNPPGDPLLASDVVEVAVALPLVCGRRRGGRVACAKLETAVLRAAEVQLGKAPLADAVALAAADSEVCAVRRGGELVCWPADPRFVLKAEPRPGLASVVRAVLGRDHGCAIRRDDTLVCWGDNRAGQLGDGTVVDRAQPVPVRGLTTVREVAVGASHTCARDDVNRVWCWGDHLAGGLAARRLAAESTREPTPVRGLPPLLLRP